MKKIEAIIRKSRFEDVKQALLAADAFLVTHVAEESLDIYEHGESAYN